ncbi:MAG: hypothetical protein ACYC1M_03130 [Armatimonadota bacterium]
MQPKTKSCLLKIGIFVLATIISWQFWMNYQLQNNIISYFEDSKNNSKMPDVSIWQDTSLNPQFYCTDKPSHNGQITLGGRSLKLVTRVPDGKTVLYYSDRIRCEGAAWRSYGGTIRRYPHEPAHYLVQLLEEDYYYLYKMDVSANGQVILKRMPFFMPMVATSYFALFLVSTPILFASMMLLRAIWLNVKACRLAASG